jgi:murein DD-endopeptidase MepM/ murein hydrolase activator NlpD
MLPLLLAAVLQAAAPQADTALFPAREDMIRLYTNCDEPRWPWGTEERFVPKTDSELRAGVDRRRALESRWRDYFNALAADSIRPTPGDSWTYPLSVRGRLLNNFANPRAGGPHEALDIFVLHEDVEVRTPISGVVVATGDDWQGGWSRAKGGFHYEGGGLSRRAGNGVMIFDPSGGGYVYFAHMQNGILVRTGDIVRAGEPLGHVGHTGNAAQPGHGKHLHFAAKHEGNGCGVDGVLLPVNPYPQVRAARGRMH